MCWCTPSLRTPHCGKPDCRPAKPADARTEPDRFRRQYRPLSDAAKAFLDRVKQKAEALAADLEALPPSREVSAALTKLEECVMWATKGITK